MGESISASESASNSAHKLATVGGLAKRDNQASIINCSRSWGSEGQREEGDRDEECEDHGGAWLKERLKGKRGEAASKQNGELRSVVVASTTRCLRCGRVRAIRSMPARGVWKQAPLPPSPPEKKTRLRRRLALRA